MKFRKIDTGNKEYVPPAPRPEQAKRDQVWLVSVPNSKGFIVAEDVGILDEFVFGHLYMLGSDEPQYNKKLKISELVEIMTSENNPVR